MTGKKSQIKCALCGKTILSKDKKADTIVETIDGKGYTFDTNDCVLMFKKFRGVRDLSIDIETKVLKG